MKNKRADDVWRAGDPVIRHRGPKPPKIETEWHYKRLRAASAAAGNRRAGRIKYSKIKPDITE